MSDDHKELIGQIETALLDAELFIKYGSPDRALRRLKTALEHSPRSIPLRERMREVAASRAEVRSGPLPAQPEARVPMATNRAHFPGPDITVPSGVFPTLGRKRTRDSSTRGRSCKRPG